MSAKKLTAKPTIVLAEDEAFIALAFQEGLERAGFKVIIVNDGDAAIKKIKEVIPDLVLLDLIMPKKNGFEVLKQLKKDATTRNIKVIILTNLGAQTDAAEADEAGAIDFLVKADHSLKEVIERVKAAIA